MWEAAVPAADGAQASHLGSFACLLFIFSPVLQAPPDIFLQLLKHNFCVSECRGRHTAVWSSATSGPHCRAPWLLCPQAPSAGISTTVLLAWGTLSPVESRVPCFPTVLPPKPPLAQPGSGLRVRRHPQVQRHRAHHGPAMNHRPLHTTQDQGGSGR